MLLTVKEYKDAIRVTGTSLDNYYESLIEYVTGLIQAECKQKLLKQTDVGPEYYSPRNTNYIVLRQRPVISITSLYYDSGGNYGQSSDSFASSTLQTAGTDYLLKLDEASGISRSGIVYLLGSQGQGSRVRGRGKLTGELEEARGSIKVTYTCGFDPIPNDLKLIMITSVRALQMMIPHGGLQVMSENRPHYGYSLGQLLNKEMTMTRMLSRYVALGTDVV